MIRDVDVINVYATRLARVHTYQVGVFVGAYGERVCGFVNSGSVLEPGIMYDVENALLVGSGDVMLDGDTVAHVQ